MSKVANDFAVTVVSLKYVSPVINDFVGQIVVFNEKIRRCVNLM
jgi:glycine cleavage system H lipoate-binding protein